MRTTLTIDDDVAAALERLRRSGDKSLKDLVNQALRHGLEQLNAPAKPRKPFRTRSVSLGRCLIGDIVSVSEAIALGEGEDHK
ncbi:MAG TPA: ribbon-helix-helix domain-containing protein [Stellaceae bacterium]|nr:ribbon-helix-helix domain-containing protein [Stellaceae bacterium]